MNTRYMLVERYGYRETLIALYSTRKEADAEKKARLDLYREMQIDHGSLIVRMAQ